MANENAQVDGNQFSALTAHSGTTDKAETRKVVATDGRMHVQGMSGLQPDATYDNVAVTYPDGTTDVFAFKAGTATVNTVTIVYLDTTKGSVSTITRA